MCILSDGDWFTPNGFQEYGGRKKCKNWKKSITCESFPLQQLLEDYSTLSGGSGEHSVPIINPHLGNSARRPSSNPVRKQTPYIGIPPPVSSTSSSLLSPPSLPVSCGAVTGILHKNRLAQGNCGKCIRTPQIWCTPEEFLALGGVTDPSTWKGQIYVRGEPLCTLFQSCQYFLLHVLCDPNNEMSATQTQPLQWEDLKQKLHRMEDGNPAHSWDFFSDVIVAVLVTMRYSKSTLHLSIITQHHISNTVCIATHIRIHSTGCKVCASTNVQD
ncbi:hypothetical protein FKM82_025646 [Ascaphus truei]